MAFALFSSIVFMYINDSTVGALIEAMLHLAHSQSSFNWHQNFSIVQMLPAVLAPLFAIILTLMPIGQARSHLIGTAKAGFAIMALAVAYSSDWVGSYFLWGTAFGWAAPWCWLCAVSTGPDKVSTGRRSFSYT